MAEPDTKVLAEILLRLHETAWANFRDRRSYEWKVSFGIWTVLAVLIGTVLQGKVALRPYGPTWFMPFASIMLLMHLFFEYRIALGHRADTAKAYFYEKLLNESLGADLKREIKSPVDFDPSHDLFSLLETVRTRISKVKGPSGCGGWVHVGIHGGVTLLLLSLLGYVLFAPAPRAGDIADQAAAVYLVPTIILLPVGIGGLVVAMMYLPRGVRRVYELLKRL